MPDWLGQSPIGANGVGTVLISQDNPAVVWEIEQVGVSVGPTSISGNVVVWKNNNLVAPTAALVPQVSQYGIATIGQAAAGLPYVYLNASDTMQIVVNGAAPGDAVTVRAQYREFNSSDPNMIGR